MKYRLLRKLLQLIPLPNIPPDNGGGEEPTEPEPISGVPGEIEPISIELDPTEGNITEIGSQRSIKAYVYPEDADQTVTWTVENTSIAKISQNYGDSVFVIGIASGTTTVTATTINGLQATATINCVW